jgi:hypothetical protein
MTAGDRLEIVRYQAIIETIGTTSQMTGHLTIPFFLFLFIFIIMITSLIILFFYKISKIIK